MTFVAPPSLQSLQLKGQTGANKVHRSVHLFEDVDLHVKRKHSSGMSIKQGRRVMPEHVVGKARKLAIGWKPVSGILPPHSSALQS